MKLRRVGQAGQAGVIWDEYRDERRDECRDENRDDFLTSIEMNIEVRNTRNLKVNKNGNSGKSRIGSPWAFNS